MNWFYVYLIGLVVSVSFFYYGGVRGGSRQPEVWSLVFGALWPITMPLIIWKVWMDFRNDKRRLR